MYAQPLVSIITINYNESGITLELLKSLRALTYPSVEVIVVDNASPNDNPGRIKEAFPEVRLIKSPENLGFAGGNNLGIDAAKGEFLFFINNDTEVPPGILEPLVETLQKHPEIGIISPKIKFHWDPSLIQYAGYTPMNPWTIRNNGIGYRQPDGPDYDTAGPTESIHGAAMMVPRRIVEEIGKMPEGYFPYYEEHDWAAMIRRAGYEAYYQPASYILHKESISTGKNSPLKTYYLTRNRVLYARRNFSSLHLLFSILYLCLISIPKNTLTFLLQRQWAHLSAYWRGITWNLYHPAAART